MPRLPATEPKTHMPAPPFRILLVSYSQTGQLSRLAGHFIAPCEGADNIEIEQLALKPQQPFPFPWRFGRFFDTFPETVRLQPQPIETPEFRHERYDLVVLAYTIWFLSPSQPVCAFLQHPAAQRILAGTPVITLIGCRNMWLMAQEEVKKLLSQAGAKLVGNIVKTDQSDAWSSFATTPLWMMTGNKRPYRWLPSAGIAEREILDMARFGGRLKQVLDAGGTPDETLFRGMGAVKIDEKLMMSEAVGRRSFRLWGALLIGCGRISPLLRRAVLWLYIVFLLLMIVTVVPLSALLRILLKPLTQQKLSRLRRYYAQPSGE